MENNRIRYTVDNVANSRFYQMSKFLFEGEFKDMSNDARVLYSLLRDRHDLSLSNEWINENNEVYLIYTRENMQNMLGLSDKPVKRAIDQLKKYKLIEEEKQGQGRPNLIYLLAVTIENTLTRRNSDSRIGNIPSQESDKLPPNDTNIKNTDISDAFLLSPEGNDENNVPVDNLNNEREKESNNEPTNEFNKILKQCQYDVFLDKNAILQAIRLLYYSAQPLKISNMSIPPTQVREDLKMLKMEHIDYAINDYEVQSKEQEIKHPVAYLSRCIYNAIFQGDLKLRTDINFKGYK